MYFSDLKATIWVYTTRSLLTEIEASLLKLIFIRAGVTGSDDHWKSFKQQTGGNLLDEIEEVLESLPVMKIAQFFLPFITSSEPAEHTRQKVRNLSKQIDAVYQIQSLSIYKSTPNHSFYHNIG